MKNLSQKLIQEKNKLDSNSPWLVLIKITLTDNEATVFRLVQNNEDIVFEGETYTAFPFDLEPTNISSKGEIPTLTLKVSNITRLIQPYLEDLDGGVGSTVLITVVNYKLLGESYSELEMSFEVIATSSDFQWVSFVLGASSLLRQRMPLYRYIAMHCRWQYGSVECTHTTATCNRTLANCRTNSNTANYGGFVGIKSGGLKIVQ